MGDLNANLLSLSEEALFVKRLANELSLKIVEHGATHHVRDSHTWIDVMLTDDNDVILRKDNKVATFASHHNIIDVEIELAVAHELTANTFSYRDFKAINQGDLISVLTNLDWSPLQYPTSDVNSMVTCLSDNLITAIDKLAPVKHYTPRSRKTPPWVNAELMSLYKKRDAVRKRYKRTRTDQFWQEFKSLAALAEQRTNEARDAFIQNKLYEAIAGKKNVWGELKTLGLLPRTGEDLHGFTPEELGLHFAGVSTSSLQFYDSELEDIVESAQGDGFTFSEVTPADVILAVSHFSSQAKGEDGIPQSVVAKALPFIAQYLANICNSSLATGNFPDPWKRAYLVPLKKTAIPSSPTDFRPIALLSFLSKVLEKTVHNQIMDYLTSRNALDPLQTGFRRQHSTQTALLKLTEDIRIGIDSKQQLLTILLLFDFTKAFDTVSPSILLRRAGHLGFSRAALRWLKSYLTSRQQSVITKTQGNSIWLFTNLGVPQGSVLGPLLFSIFINDVTSVLGDEIRHILYADDLQIYTQVPRSSFDEGVRRLAEAARAVSAWASASALHLNISKTKAIIFGSDYNVNFVSSLNLAGIEIGPDQTVPFADTVVNLGVTMDSKLSWKPHIDCVAKKVNRALYILRFFRHSTTEALRKQLASALIIPHLDYCSLVYLDVTSELGQRLQRLQNSCVRYIYGVGRDEHITPYRVKLGWLDVNGRRNYFMAIMLYKILNIRQPAYLFSFFQKHQARSTGRGERKDLSVPMSRTNTGMKSFHAQGARIWNSIPSDIRCLPSLRKFKSSICRHLLHDKSVNVVSGCV